MKNSNERLRHQLEVQSFQIEEFLTRHDVPAEVAGGTVRSRWVNFDLNTQISAGLEKLRHLGSELASTLGAADVSISQQDDRLRIAVKQPKNHAVDLLDLLDALTVNSPMTAALGLDVAERPVLLNLQADDVVNILVAGEKDAGKTALLRTFALSLALQNKQSQIQMAILDVGPNSRNAKNKPSLYPLNYLPHVMFNIVENFREAAEALSFLVSEANYRIEQSVAWPLLVLMIDNVDYLVEMGGQPIIESLTFLLEEGENAGMRVVLGATNPEAPSLRPLLKNTMPVRLVGQVNTAAQARAITGVQESQAEYLMGGGDFIAVSNGMILPFQAAYINDYDLLLILDKLHRQNQPVMLAQPMTVRPTLDDPDEEDDEPQTFEYNSQNRRANLSPATERELEIPLPRIIESMQWKQAEKFDDDDDEETEEAENLEAVDYEDDWYDDEAEADDVILVDKRRNYAVIQKKSVEEEEDDWDEDENDSSDSAPLEVWSKPTVEPKNNRLSTSYSDEIEFEWE